MRTMRKFTINGLLHFLTRIVGYADGATDPIDFPIAPRFATDKLLKVDK